MAGRSRRSAGATLAACRRSSIPVAITMAGGYARDIEDTVDIHFETVRTVVESGFR